MDNIDGMDEMDGMDGNDENRSEEQQFEAGSKVEGTKDGNEMNGNNKESGNEQHQHEEDGAAMAGDSHAADDEEIDRQLKEQHDAIHYKLSRLWVSANPHDGSVVEIGGYYFHKADRDEVQRLYEQRSKIEKTQKYRKWLRSDAGKLCAEFYRKFQEYRRYVEEHSYMRKEARGFSEHELFEMGLKVAMEEQRQRAERDRRNLERARQAARCVHIHENGEQCGCPKLKGKERCYMHQRLEDAKALEMDLGTMEDPDSIQVGIKRLQKATIEQSLSDTQIRRLTTLLRIAMWNAPRTTFANRG